MTKPLRISETEELSGNEAIHYHLTKNKYDSSYDDLVDECLSKCIITLEGIRRDAKLSNTESIEINNIFLNNFKSFSENFSIYDKEVEGIEYEYLNVLNKTFLAYLKITIPKRERSSIELIDILIKKFRPKYNFLGSYIRENDTLSKFFSGDYESVNLVNLHKNLVIAKINHILHWGTSDELQTYLIEHRRDIDKNIMGKIIQIIFSLDNNASIDYRIMSSIFKVRTESLLNEKGKTSGVLKFDKHFKSYLTSEELVLSSESCLMILDAVFEKNFGKLIDTDSLLISNTYQDSKVIFSEIEPSDYYFDYVPGRKIIFLITLEKLDIFKYKIFDIEFKIDDSLFYLRDQPDLMEKNVNLKNMISDYVRERIGVSKIGKGRWVSEELILKIVEKETNYRVVHQWRTSALGRQSIDIAIPDLKLALEYNGIQHYEAVDFFGGEPSLVETQKRDKKKAKILSELGFKLVIIKYNESYEDIIAKVKDYITKAKEL